MKTTYGPRRARRYLKSYRRSVAKAGPLTRAQASSVAKIARSVVQSQAELKSYYTTWTSINYDNLVSGFNPIYPISQGATAETAVGEKIFLKDIQVSGFMYPAITTSFANSTMARLIVIHSRDKLFSGSQSNITSSNIFRANGSGYLTVDQLDRHKITVLHDSKWTIPQYLTAATTHTPFYAKVPIGKTETFDADGSGYLKDGQYFVALIMYDGRGTGSNFWGAKLNTSVNFTDI